MWAGVEASVYERYRVGIIPVISAGYVGWRDRQSSDGVGIVTDQHIERGIESKRE